MENAPGQEFAHFPLRTECINSGQLLQLQERHKTLVQVQVVNALSTLSALRQEMQLPFFFYPCKSRSPLPGKSFSNCLHFSLAIHKKYQF